MNFLVNIEVSLPVEMPMDTRQEILAREAARSAELAQDGLLRHIWRIPGRFATWSLWSAPDATALHDGLTSLPLWPYMDVTVHPLADHPGDPR